MDRKSCECGFASSVQAELTDHLLEMFSPVDGKVPGGTAHEEGPVKLACLCGFTAQSSDELDAHFLEVFTPGDSIGIDGGKHLPVSSPADGAQPG